VNLVANRAQSGRAEIVLNNALAFGGYDAVVTFAKPGRLPDPVLADQAFRAAQASAARARAIAGGTA
jgi:hypothetical protein